MNLTKLKRNAAVNPGVDTPCACNRLAAGGDAGQSDGDDDEERIRIPIEGRAAHCAGRASQEDQPGSRTPHGCPFDRFWPTTAAVIRRFSLNSAFASTRVYAGTSSCWSLPTRQSDALRSDTGPQSECCTGVPLMLGRAPVGQPRPAASMAARIRIRRQVKLRIGCFDLPARQRIPARVELDAADPRIQHVVEHDAGEHVRRRRRQLDSRLKRLGRREIVIRSAEDRRFERGGRSEPDAMPPFQLNQSFRAEVRVPFGDQEDRAVPRQASTPRLSWTVRSAIDGVRRAREAAAQTRWRGDASQMARADGSTPQPPNVSYSSFEPSVRASQAAPRSHPGETC